MARSFDPNAWSRGNENIGGGATNRLVTSLIGIQQRKEEQARQQQLDALHAQQVQAEIQNQQAEAQHRDFQTKLAILPFLQAAAAKTPGETVPIENQADIPAGGNAAPAVVPSTPYKLQIPGGQSFDIPMLNQQEADVEKAHAVQQEADRQRALAKAKGAVELTPEMIAQMPESIRPFFQPGQLQEPLNGAAIAASIRAENQPDRAFKTVDLGDRVEFYDQNNKLVDTKPKGATPGSLSGLGGLYKATDPKAIADQIENGESSPLLTGVGRVVAGAVQSELAHRGFNLAKAQMDWNGTVRHVASLNSPAQTRLRQAFQKAHDSLDLVDQLVQQWKGSGFPLLNSVSLAAARQGLQGPEAQSLANQLGSQIAILSSELGQAYMGGNSPTDHALKLAQQTLQSNWSEKSLLDSTKLLRRDLSIGLNAMNTIGPAGVSADNPYDFNAQEKAGPASPAAGGPQPGAALSTSGGVVTVASPEEAAKLPSGTKFKTPDGRVFTRN